MLKIVYCKEKKYVELRISGQTWGEVANIQLFEVGHEVLQAHVKLAISLKPHMSSLLPQF